MRDVIVPHIRANAIFGGSPQTFINIHYRDSDKAGLPARYLPAETASTPVELWGESTLGDNDFGYRTASPAPLLELIS